MWEHLWDDFEARSARLVAGEPPWDAVDETIQWQLEGHNTFVGPPILEQNLHLPELYSGSPWQHRERWIAFVAVNPSIDPMEIFPTRTHFANHQLDLVSYFADRFEPGPADFPVTHGRSGANVAVWKNRENVPRPYGQQTWARIDAAIRRCLAPTDLVALEAPLGRVAMIVDAVPWKFRNWAKVHPETKAGLLELGSPYLVATLQERPPAVVISAGEHVRRLMHHLYPDTIPPYERRLAQNGAVTIGDLMVPWYGVVHPVNREGNRFTHEMAYITAEISELII